MNKNIKLKGQLRNHMIWPWVLNVILIVGSVLAFMVGTTVGCIALVCAIVALLITGALYYQLRSVLLEELSIYGLEYNQIQKKLIAELDMPYAIIDRNGKVVWGNHLFEEVVEKKLFSRGVQHIFKGVKLEEIQDLKQKKEVRLEYDDHAYKAFLTVLQFDDFSEQNQLIETTKDVSLIALSLYDQTELLAYIKENQDQKLASGIIFVDNYEEVLNSTDSERRSLLSALIERKITKYMHSFDGIVTKVEKDKYIFVIQQKHLPIMQEGKFSIMDEVREIGIGNEIPVTLCIGIGVNASTYNQALDWAKSATDLALGRGGDQTVIKNKEKISYYGGKKKTVEKGTRVRARVKAHALRQLILGKEKVLIMGHKMGDVDSFGAAIGIYRCAKTIGKRAYIVIDDVTKSVRQIKTLFEGKSGYEEDLFISSEKALELVNENTAVVVVDVNKPSLTQCEGLLAKSKSIIVFDHHRQSSESIENAVLSYIEPFASSTCEMISEILQYIGDNVKVTQAEADALYAGVMIDTNNFLNKTGVRTFEAAAFLKKNGADVNRIRTLFRDDLDTYRIRGEAVGSALLFNDYFAFTECKAKGVESPTIVGAQVANELLNIEGVKASFVFTMMEDTVYISARSLEGLNVQLILESIGGGGHSTIAGAQLKGTTVEAAMTLLQERIQTMLSEGDI